MRLALHRTLGKGATAFAITLKVSCRPRVSGQIRRRSFMVYRKSSRQRVKKPTRDYIPNGRAIVPCQPKNAKGGRMLMPDSLRTRCNNNKLAGRFWRLMWSQSTNEVAERQVKPGPLLSHHLHLFRPMYHHRMSLL